MSASPHYASLSWDQVNMDCMALADRLQQDRWKGILAVTRGGLVPAAILARCLDLRHIETVCISSYEDVSRGDLHIIRPVPDHIQDCKGKGWLIVDDLVDSGATARELKRLLPLGHLVTLYAKPAGESAADLFLRSFPADCWIIFPWEDDPREPAALSSSPGVSGGPQ